MIQDIASLRILLVSDYGYLAGGAELMLLRLRDELRSRGHDVQFFSTHVSEPGKPVLADYSCLGTDSGFRTLLQTANPWAAHRLSRVIREFQPDVVHVRIFLTQLSPLILPLLKNIPSIYHLAWYRPICPTGLKILPGGEPCRVRYGRACLSNNCLPMRDWAPLMLQMRLLRRWRHNFNLLVANSQAMKSRLGSEDFGPVEVVHNGVPIAPRLARHEGRPSACFAGRLVKVKGTQVLLDAFEKVVKIIPEAELLIAGDGPELNNMERTVRENGLEKNIRFLGFLGDEALAEELKSAWVQVVPSIWEEPFGLVAVEAMMRGKAVIASDHGGLTEIVRHGETGLLVTPNDSQALAGALTRVLENRDYAKSLGTAAYERAVEKFSLETFCDRFMEFYGELAPRSG
jgi:glycosyltransferase involved in cell wall biosynthesis